MAKTTSKKKVLAVRIPADHPVWKLPRGQRTKAVLAALDAAVGHVPPPQEDPGSGLSNLERRVAAVEKKVSDLENRLEPLLTGSAAAGERGAVASGTEVPDAGSTDREREIDWGAFFAAFDK